MRGRVGDRARVRRPQRIGAVSGAIGAGSRVSPMSARSTAAAHERPSAIAHTMRLCPRPMSPHTNTLSRLVAVLAVPVDVAAFVERRRRAVRAARSLGTDESHREEHDLARQFELGAFDRFERHAAVDDRLFDFVRAQRAEVAVVVAEEALGVHREDALAALFVCGRRRGRSAGTCGQGCASGRSSGGRGRISNWCTDWPRPGGCAVPRQSAPVSPPPMITTRLPAAVIGGASRSPSCTRFDQRQVLHRLVDARELAAGDRQVAPRGGAAREHDRVGGEHARRPGRSSPTFALVRNSVPSRLHLRDAPVEVALLHLELGDAVAQQPPMRSARS